MSDGHELTEVDVTLPDGRVVLGVLHSWTRRADSWWGHVTVYDRGEGRRDVVPADRLRPAAYCPWYRGALACQHACDRGAGRPVGAATPLS